MSERLEAALFVACCVLTTIALAWWVGVDHSPIRAVVELRPLRIESRGDAAATDPTGGE